MISLGKVLVSQLLLDPKNPRLPRNLSNRSQEKILEHLYRRATLQELAESIYNNGYFSSEPLIVGPAGPDGKRVVLEGNRRLATILILSQETRAESAGLQFRIDGSPVVMTIPAIPAMQVDDPAEFQAYLGFRHISGLRMWGAGEKATYIWHQVRSAKDASSAFYDIGRQIGSNARGVRSAFIAYELLEHARREGVEVDLIDYVLSERFGVWSRLLGTANVTDYIGLADMAGELPDVTEKIARVERDRLREVLQDLRPAAGRSEALIRDSRQVTDYSDTLASGVAREVLRSSGNLELASAIANRPNTDAQLQAIIDQVEVLTRAFTDGTAISENAHVLSLRLSKAARLLHMTVTSFGDES